LFSALRAGAADGGKIQTVGFNGFATPRSSSNVRARRVQTDSQEIEDLLYKHGLDLVFVKPSACRYTIDLLERQEAKLTGNVTNAVELDAHIAGIIPNAPSDFKILAARKG